MLLVERRLPHGRGNGSKNASFKIRKATRSHAFGSPASSEGGVRRMGRTPLQEVVNSKWGSDGDARAAEKSGMDAISESL